MEALSHAVGSSVTRCAVAVTAAVTAVGVLRAARALRRRSHRRAVTAAFGAKKLQPLFVITGASSGVGRDMALQIAAECGAAVGPAEKAAAGAGGSDAPRPTLILTARREAELRDVAYECEEAAKRSGKVRETARSPVDVIVVPCDITVPADRARLFEAVAKVTGPPQDSESQGRVHLRLLVLNAGLGGISPFDGTDRCLEIARRLMDVNYFSNFALLQLFKPMLVPAHAAAVAGRTTGNGGRAAVAALQPRVLAVSSLSGVLPTPHRTAYCASKFALQGFLASLRQEREVLVTVASPGLVQTPFHSKVMTTGSPPRERKHGSFMPSAVCARQALAAAANGDDEYVMTTSGWVGYRVRPFISWLVDGIATKKSEDTFKH